MSKEKLDDLWRDDRNWGHGAWGAYFCKEDPRLVVPKRGWVGGTFNLAHRLAMPLMALIIAVLVLLVVVLAFVGIRS